MRVALLGVTTRPTHGVPVVMNLLADGLSRVGSSVRLVASGYHDGAVEVTDAAGGAARRYHDRRGLLVAVADGREEPVDLLHVHSAHVADDVPRPDGSRDPLPLAHLVAGLGARALVFTDHHNPSETRRQLVELHGVDLLALTDRDRDAFLVEAARRDEPAARWFHRFHCAMVLGRRQLMRMAGAVVHVSAAQRSEEAALLPGYQFDERHVVIWNGTDMDRFAGDIAVLAEAARLRASWAPAGQRVVLHVGRGVEEKGIVDLAEAVGILRAAGEAVKLVYLGAMGDEERRRVAALIPDAVMAGLVTERRALAAAYAAADLVAQPTWGECFNLAIAEGLAMGTPGAVSDAHGPAEVYVRRGLAVGHPARDPEALARALRRGLSDETLRAAILRRAQILRPALTAARMTDDHRRLYARLLDRPRRPGSTEPT